VKTNRDPRHKARKEVVKQLFAKSFAEQDKLSPETNDILSKLESIDKRIQEAAPAWPIEKLNRIDLAVLRLALYELDKNEAPPKVVIDEAVELAKEYGSENSSSFVNGVLGTIYKSHKSTKKEQ